MKCWLALLSFAAVLGSSITLAVEISTVAVGNPGNLADPLTGLGSVSYAYRIGTTEVTNAQYTEFLNAHAASDPLGLYNPNMGSNPRGGISRTGSNGSYSYSTKPNMSEKPVNYVSFFDAARFANWLNNGQGNGDTETGAYTLLGGTPAPSNWQDNIVRNANATWFLTTESEWYKAAYYDPTIGSNGGYWAYPTRSNAEPGLATADNSGAINNPGANIANFRTGADWNGQDGNLTDVGSAGPLSESYYRTSDQGGNVLEWNEYSIGGFRGIRGGSFWSLTGLQSSFRGELPSGIESVDLGFRVATIPEPSTYALAAAGTIGFAVFRRRRRRRLRASLG